MKLKDVIELFQLPEVRINLMLEKTADNDPFFDDTVRRFYEEAIAPHPKLLFAARKYQFGFAVCELPRDFQTYFMALDASARRNYKKALRLGYSFERFQYNDQLDAIREILQSTPVRQGILPKAIREGKVRPNADPPSRTAWQDYPYFGVFKGTRLVAYAACLISGELCSINDLYGHAGHLEDGVVPMAIIGAAQEILRRYPAVKYFAYGTYFGASDSMRRFKRKFLFYPHQVSWVLETPQVAA